MHSRSTSLSATNVRQLRQCTLEHQQCWRPDRHHPDQRHHVLVAELRDHRGIVERPIPVAPCVWRSYSQWGRVGTGVLDGGVGFLTERGSNLLQVATRRRPRRDAGELAPAEEVRANDPSDFARRSENNHIYPHVEINNYWALAWYPIHFNTKPNDLPLPESEILAWLLTLPHGHL